MKKIGCIDYVKYIKFMLEITTKSSSKSTMLTPCIDDLIKRDFTADAPNRKWVIDITEHPRKGRETLSLRELKIYS